MSAQPELLPTEHKGAAIRARADERVDSASGRALGALNDIQSSGITRMAKAVALAIAKLADADATAEYSQAMIRELSGVSERHMRRQFAPLEALHLLKVLTHDGRINGYDIFHDDWQRLAVVRKRHVARVLDERKQRSRPGPPEHVPFYDLREPHVVAMLREAMAAIHVHAFDGPVGQRGRRALCNPRSDEPKSDDRDKVTCPTCRRMLSLNTANRQLELPAPRPPMPARAPRCGEDGVPVAFTTARLPEGVDRVAAFQLVREVVIAFGVAPDEPDRQSLEIAWSKQIVRLWRHSGMDAPTFLAHVQQVCTAASECQGDEFRWEIRGVSRSGRQRGRNCRRDLPVVLNRSRWGARIDVAHRHAEHGDCGCRRASVQAADAARVDPKPAVAELGDDQVAAPTDLDVVSAWRAALGRLRFDEAVGFQNFVVFIEPAEPLRVEDGRVVLLLPEEYQGWWLDYYADVVPRAVGHPVRLVDRRERSAR